MFGTTIGPVLGAPLLSYIIALYGWRAAFVICSLLAVVALALWWRFGGDGPDATVGRGSAIVPHQLTAVRTGNIWLDPTIIGSLVGGFCAYWSIGFAIAWLAPFLRTALGFDALTTGWLISLIFIGQGVIGLGVTAVSHMLTKRGVTSRKARAWCVGAMQLASSAAFAATALAETVPPKVLLILVATSLPGVTFTLGPSIISDVMPPGQRNRTIGIIMSVVSLAGLAAPYLSGLLISGRSGRASYDHALLLAAGVLAIGGVASLALLQPEASRRRLTRVA
jgi:predicted MFS family arabinose efflux permease